MRPLVIVACGGHAEVVADIVRASGLWRLLGGVDRDPAAASHRASMRVLGDDSLLPSLLKKGVRHAAVGLGSVGDTRPRARLRASLAELGFELPALAHPKAVVAESARLGSGSQVMAGCVVNPGAAIGDNCVVNTGAVIEHDCALGDSSFVGPGAVLGGSVTVGPGAFIGLGARVLQGLRIGARALVGAGAVVVRDVPPGAVVAGVPARPRSA